MNRLFCIAILLGATACDTVATDVHIEDIPRGVLVEVSGGIAAADYAYHVDPPTGAFVGVRCHSLCDFQPGDTLFVLSAVQSEMLDAAISSAGGWSVGGVEDHGVPCCDQFAYRLTFSEDGTHEGVVSGTTESLPAAYAVLVGLLEELRRGVVPIILEDGPRIEGYPHDPVEILATKLDAPILEVTVRYGGGCARHDFDLVVHSGWRESFPVQVDADLAHDGHDDLCDAFLTDTIRFDLTPLREAYREMYGSGPGAVTIGVGAASGGSRTSVAWSF